MPEGNYQGATAVHGDSGDTPTCRKVIRSLAVGQTYLLLAAALMHSARAVAGNRYEYVVFHGHCDANEFAACRWIRFVNLDSIVFRRTDEKALLDSPNLPCYFKALPFVHEDYLDADMLFLDADCLVFCDRFDEIFDLIRERSVVMMSSAT